VPKMDRRSFLATAAALAATTAMAPEAFLRNFDPDAEPTHYPAPDVVQLGKRFKYEPGSTPIMRLYRGTLWVEGPARNGAGRYRLWSDIPNDGQLRWPEEDGHVAHRFRSPAGNTRFPEICSNVCFGRSKRDRLFVTDSQSLYAAYVGTCGAHIT